MKVTVYGRGKSSLLLARQLCIRRNATRADIIIRYKDVSLYPYHTIEINKASAIKLASNKLKALVTFKDAGLKVPDFDTSLLNLTERIGCGKIVFARDIYHSKGSDIVIIESGQEPIAKDYFIQYIKPRGEYRYHVAFGKVILHTKKVLAEGEEDDSLIRNHQDGKWKQVVCTPTEKFEKACIEAVKALGLDFGAVDFINYKKEPYILEVNTAPGLQVENRLEAYGKAIKEHIEETYSRRSRIAPAS